jgi:hypothetical protein
LPLVRDRPEVQFHTQTGLVNRFQQSGARKASPSGGDFARPSSPGRAKNCPLRASVSLWFMIHVNQNFMQFPWRWKSQN